MAGAYLECSPRASALQTHLDLRIGAYQVSSMASPCRKSSISHNRKQQSKCIQVQVSSKCQFSLFKLLKCYPAGRVRGSRLSPPPRRNRLLKFRLMLDQFRQTFKPELHVAKQLGREIFRPQLALPQVFPLLRRGVRQSVSPHDPPPCPAILSAKGPAAAEVSPLRWRSLVEFRGGPHPVPLPSDGRGQGNRPV